jgi:S-formylglutathione hydrolase
MKKALARWGLCLLLATGLTGILPAQTGEAKHGVVQRIKVHGKSLEGNLAGDSLDRDVSIYLPPSYQTDRNRRYPVLYLLHGFTDSDDKWFSGQPHFITLPAVVEQALAKGQTREMIVVMPNAYTRYQGSFYGSSAVTGDWETYVAQELVSYVDTHYRTIATVASRGLAGHSMGGYGTIRIGMKRPDVFSSLYAMSSCCLTANMLSRENMESAEAVRSLEDFVKAPFLVKAVVTVSAAWSPNPKNPPFFFDLPLKNGEVQSAVMEQWAANAPVSVVSQYVPNLKRLRAIAFDVGEQDMPSLTAGVRQLDQVLGRFDIPHVLEVYQGDHVNKIAERMETKVLPFFSQQLSFPGR